MPKINLLPKNVAELIAAGEVVERPASVIKELVENSIDAGATAITVEISRGGITYMRVTDNGCGIDFSDVPTAFLRHATSKISSGDDLESIGTLGFRGEALAAVSSVSKVEMLTATENSDFGAHYVIEGGQEITHEEIGCPKGTTIIIKDLFYNTPARMKFLKKDVSEGNAVASVIDRIALSHPEISFKLIRDGKQTLSTSGNGDLKGTVYSILGREFTSSLIDVTPTSERVTVSGLICKPVSCKPTRNNQFTFLNGRLVRSGTVIAAVEQAYKNSAMIGKFPAFILYLSVPYDTVDVNVHPAKTEVRFSDEKVIFDAVYVAVKNALTKGDTRPEVKLKQNTYNPYISAVKAEYKQVPIVAKTLLQDISKKQITPIKTVENNSLRNDDIPSFINKYSVVDENGEESAPIIHTPAPVEVKANKEEKPSVVLEKLIDEDKPIITILGQAFQTYIVAQMNDSIYFIDKHAAHERILFNSLKEKTEISVQQLLTARSVTLTPDEYDAIISNGDVLLKSGFEIDDFGNNTVLVRSIPSFLISEDIDSMIQEIAESVLKTGSVSTAREDNLFHTIACKAAIKAGSITSRLEMQSLAEKVLTSQEIMYCPHGRPVAYEIKKRELEKQFGRIQ